MSASSLSASKPQRARAAHLGPERRRPLILDIALELFLKRGYKGTSMEAVANAAGVSKPVIYACFESKAELLGALLDREEQRMLGQLSTALVSGRRSGDVRAMLTAGFTSMFRAVKDTPEVYRIALLGEGDADAIIEARVRHGRDRQIAATADTAREWLRERVPAERLDTVSQFVAQTLIATGEAGVRMMLAAPEDWTPELLGATLAELSVGGYSSFMKI
jgi:AcrR family transcriptional regulator